jgi:hypothetical protein
MDTQVKGLSVVEEEEAGVEAGDAEEGEPENIVMRPRLNKFYHCSSCL